MTFRATKAIRGWQHAFSPLPVSLVIGPRAIAAALYLRFLNFGEKNGAATEQSSSGARETPVEIPIPKLTMSWTAKPGSTTPVTATTNLSGRKKWPSGGYSPRRFNLSQSSQSR